MQERALPVGIEAAPILALILVGVVVPIGELEIAVVSGGLIGKNARPPKVFVQQTRNGEGIVAHELSLEAPRRLARQESIIRIDVSQFRSLIRILPVSRRHDDQSNHMLHVPRKSAGLSEQRRWG